MGFACGRTNILSPSERRMPKNALLRESGEGAYRLVWARRSSPFSQIGEVAFRPEGFRQRSHQHPLPLGEAHT